jgi:hypothetical protein
MFRMFRRMSFFNLLTIGQTVLLARRHFKRLDAHDRRRLAQLVRRGRGMSRDDRDDLRRILGKLEPRDFALTTAGRFSPVRVPRRFRGRSAR